MPPGGVYLAASRGRTQVSGRKGDTGVYQVTMRRREKGLYEGLWFTESFLCDLPEGDLGRLLSL